MLPFISFEWVWDAGHLVFHGGLWYALNIIGIGMIGHMRADQRVKHKSILNRINRPLELQLIEINHPKRLVKFNYDAEGRICLIGDYTGRQWGYGYDSFGDLVSVTTPKTERYDCGLTVNYDYSSAFHSGNLQHNLTRIIDASGQIYLETEYGTSQGLDNFNRVVRQRQGGGEYQFE